jgi:hypothetical protein
VRTGPGCLIGCRLGSLGWIWLEAIPNREETGVVRFLFGVFIVLHGLVHLLYSAHSRRLVQLGSELAWPDGSWAFSRLLGSDATRLLASVLYVLAAIGFVAGGAGVLVGQAWWRTVIVASAAFSAAIVVLFWDGKRRMMVEKGLLALLINIAILVAVLVLQWPQLGF